jgi:hypothetical protein
MATLQDAVKAIQNEVLSIAGIKDAPQYPPEQITDFPFAVCYARDGTWEWVSFGSVQGAASLVVELHVARKDLPHDIEKAMAFSDSVPEAIMGNDRLSDCGYELNGPISWTFGPMSWGSLEDNTLGFRWVIPVEKDTTPS